MSAANRPHAGSSGGVVGSELLEVVGPAKIDGTGVEPLLPKNRPAQAFLNTPSCGGAPVPDGRNTLARSFHVIIGTIVSTRLSYAASSNENPPPYEPPTAATRG